MTEEVKDVIASFHHEMKLAGAELPTHHLKSIDAELFMSVLAANHIRFIYLGGAN